MWRMKWISLVLAYVLVIHVAFQHRTYGQKKWDGGGGDSLWNNPNNWQPNGIPDSSDNVILDNQWILSDYHVLLPDSMVTSNAYSIRIQPSQGSQINLIIPSTNTAAPALSLSALDTAIYIGDRGSLLNNAGASAGNPIVLVGKFKIANGGKYIHQTLRGNALLISNLVADPETEKGIFEFNVPGNSAYTISASGRTFGSLVLNGQTTTRKTYTSSGSNKLTIQGDFIIQEQAGFSSSLTNTISVAGALNVMGRLYLNPVSGDTAGRNLVTGSSDQLISISGLFNQGIHFRKWIIQGKCKFLNSTVQLDQTSGIIQFTSGSSVDLGTSIIKGLGTVTVDSNARIASAAPTIAGNDSLSTLQTAKIEIHHQADFSCYGPNEQSIGERFPNKISSLSIEKSMNNLKLVHSLTVSDSLLLKKGIINLPDTSVIRLGDYTDPGNDSSFIAGGVLQSSKRREFLFPTGIDSIFAPVRIISDTGIITQLKIKVDWLSLLDTPQTTHLPVEKITGTICWTISTPDTTQSGISAQLEIQPYQIESLHCIAALDVVDNTWKLAQNSKVNPNSNKLSANIKLIPYGRFTIGQLTQHALPLNSIFLKKINTRDEIILQWTVNDDENAQYYIIDQSKDGIHFEMKDSTVSIKDKGQVIYRKTLKNAQKQTLFFRVIGVDIDGKRYYSNIIHVQPVVLKTGLFPNPSSDQLHITTNQKIISMKIIRSDGMVVGVPPIHNEKGYSISVASLPIGNYFLWIATTGGQETIAFFKQ